MNNTAIIPAVLDLKTPLRRAAAVSLGSVFVALLSQLALPLPFSPVPLTGQTLGVLLVGAALGGTLAAQSLLLYLALGIAGAPVFAAGGSGLAWLLGPSGGYLIAFPVAAWLVGELAQLPAFKKSPWRAFTAMLLGSAVIYALGLIGLAVWLTAASKAVSLAQLLTMGLWPFVPGDVVKALAAAGLLPASWRLLAAFGYRY